MNFLFKISEKIKQKKLKLAKKITIYFLATLFGIAIPYAIALAVFAPIVYQYRGLTDAPFSLLKHNSKDVASAAEAEISPVHRGFPEISLAPDRVIKAYRSQATVYHSVPWETDSDPFTTSAGTHVRDGIVAANCLAFGTRLRMPELFGDKIFVVEDRLHPSKTCFVIDIWQEYNPPAPSFGAPITKIEILDNSPRQSWTWL